MSWKLARPVGLCAALTIPALFLRLSGTHPAALLGLLVFGAAVVAASFLLAWAAEAARVDISGALAIAILAVIAVLPEYAVDLYFSYAAGHDPGYVQYAAANMTGSNRLLLGLGWPVVVIIALKVASRRSCRGVRELVLHSGYRVELGFLLIASLVALVVPLSGQISLVLGFVLLGLFVFYLWKVAQASVSEPELVGAAARIGGLPARGRRLLVAGIPGAGKSTLMRTLRPDRTLRISDSDPLRSAVMCLLPRGMRYGLVRPAVHLLHRASVVSLALGPAATVVVHLPATSARLRRAVTALARLSRRTAYLVWLDVPAAEARDGQRARGRMVTARSFERHAPPGRAGQRADTRPPARRGMGHHLAARPRGRPRRAADTNRRPAAPP